VKQSNHSAGAVLLRLMNTINELPAAESQIIYEGLTFLDSLSTRFTTAHAAPQRKPRVAKAVVVAKPVKRRRRRAGTKVNYDVNRLIALRLNKKLTQGELARQLKVHFSTISQAEKGNCSAPLLGKLSKYFDTPLALDESESAVIDTPKARLIKTADGLYIQDSSPE
jgi:DNA-binding XRE family transcriptional regulator